MSDFDQFALFYDADYGNYDEDVMFFRQLARRTGGPILEAMCGSGRVLVPLAKDGHTVTGIDISPALLERAAANLQAAGAARRAALHAGDIREPLPGGPYALAFVALNSFMHLETTDDQLAALAQLHAALAPGGVLALALFNPNLQELAQHGGELVLDKMFSLPDGTAVQKYVIQQSDPATQTTAVTFVYDKVAADGLVRRTTLPFTMRWLYRYELEHLLARVGFALEAVYGSYDLDEYSSESAHLLAVARRG